VVFLSPVTEAYPTGPDVEPRLTGYYSPIGKDLERAQIWSELEAKYEEKPGPSFKLKSPEREDLISGLSFDEDYAEN